MEIYISEFSKYVIALLIALYTFECFAVFRYEDEEGRQGIYFRQSFWMFVLHFSCLSPPQSIGQAAPELRPGDMQRHALAEEVHPSQRGEMAASGDGMPRTARRAGGGAREIRIEFAEHIACKDD